MVVVGGGMGSVEQMVMLLDQSSAERHNRMLGYVSDWLTSHQPQLTSLIHETQNRLGLTHHMPSGQGLMLMLVN